MLRDMDPLDISLLIINKKIISALHEIVSPDVFEINTTEFKKDGLFSELIFGIPGSKERMVNFAYIDLNVKVLHPRVFKEIISLSSFYKKIVYGTDYAVFDEKEKDFIPATKADGDTGFNFFLKHYDKIDFKQTGSTKREFKIKFIKKYSLNEVLIDKYLVIPAGLRDYTLTESGKELEHEINALYRRVLRVASSAKQFKDDTSSNNFINSVRLRVQKSINEVYDYIENLLDGKGGFIQDKWTKRSINYGTRNVITAAPNEIKDLKDKHRPHALSAEVGLLQATKGLLPMAIFSLRNNFLYDVFDPESTKARLINAKTLKREMVDISEATRGKWVSDEGLEDTINKLRQPEIITSNILIDKHFLFLIEETKDTIRVIDDINKYPNIDTKTLRPITYMELIYLAMYDIVKKYPAFITRYPITGLGSIDIVEPYLKTTLESRRMNVYLRGSTDPILLNEYPILGKSIYTGLAIPQIMLEALAADFDGDKISLNFVWEEESVQEMKKALDSRKYYITPENEILFSANTLTNEIMMKDMTE